MFEHTKICKMQGVQYVVLGALAPIFVQVISKKAPYILLMQNRNFIRRKQVQFFILSGNLLLRESRFHTVNCLKSFDLSCSSPTQVKVVDGSLWYICT